MSNEWVRVIDRLPDSDTPVWATDGKRAGIAHIWKGDNNSLVTAFVSNGGAFANWATHWMPVEMPLPPQRPTMPKLTVKEALREAIAELQNAWAFSLQMQSEKEDFGRLIDLAGEMYEVKFREILPRLRAALESEE